MTTEGRRYVFDLETDGLLPELTKIQSLVLKDLDSGEVFSCADQEGYVPIDEGLQILSEASEIIGHNVIRFDVPAIQKVRPGWTTTATVRDTLVLTRLIYSDIKDKDGKLLKKGKLPGRLYGSHSLEAWGYRLGDYKGDYKGPWDVWSPEMQDYCEQDVEVTTKLYNLLLSKDYSQDAIDLEHAVAWLCAQIERNGFPFDASKAAKLYAELSKERNKLEGELKAAFGSWYENQGLVKTPKTVSYKRPEWGEVIRKRISPKTGKELKPYIGPVTEDYTEGAPYCRVRYVEFNPSSRQQIAKRLIQLYGWKPQEFTDKGQPKIDESTLSSLVFPEAKLLARYFLIEKRLGQVAEGNQAWLKVFREDTGCIHGSINPNGAVTGRATHAYPNIAQVPSVGAEYGRQCRELFGVPTGWVQVGADLSGLELRCLGHFMARWDNGEYAQEVVNGDIHTKNQMAAGLPTRNNAKTFIYGFLYGAGDAKIGSIVGKGPKVGKQLKERFLNQTPALKHLRDAVGKAAKARGKLKGIDGRWVKIRSEHAALNTLLQSAGALLCKKWIVLVDQKLKAAGYKHGWDGHYAFMAWVHDEIQIACREGLEETVGQVCLEAAEEAGKHFNFRVPIAAEYKVGRNWAETH